MNKKKFNILLLVVINFVMLICKSQNVNNVHFNYYKIDLKSEETNISTLMRNNYKKEFYSNEQLTIYKNQKNEYLELIYFYKNGTTEKHLIKNNKHYKLKNFNYTADDLGELSDFQKEERKKMYLINKKDIKNIHGNKCIKIILKKTDSPESIEMYVSTDIPNLPNHFPLPNIVFNGEPLEIKISIFSENIEFGVTEFMNNINIEKDLGISIENPKEISESEYIKLTE